MRAWRCVRGRGQGCRVGLCVLRPIERELSLLVAAVAALGALGAAVQSAARLRLDARATASL